ncbi:CPBP family intramembrane glutamic endopeptidase [Lysinibacillus cavernae]|uniref:CPBP family intramembrane glutamic endopeptidase n=1 Tax=Lysinibacillus cavernae TaxID=2666135 RepID=UPI001E317ADB|nr:CPBP family intramembrane glutamic endopeptidase [Lysinibacillus cavernae]
MMIESMISAVLQVMLFSVLPFIWWFCTAKKEQSFLTWLGFQKPIIMDKGRFALFFVLSSVVLVVPNTALILFYIDRSLVAANQFAGLGLAGVIPALFYAIIQTGLSEEILFRGFLLKRLAKSFGFHVGNLLQSIVFGCVHGAMLWSALPVLVILLVVLSTGLAGYVMGWLNERIAGGSIVASWSLHSIVNLIAASLFMFKF